MLDADLVSVVIPCFNQARFLCEAIESVQHQSYRNFEITVVDDGSSDETPKVLSRYLVQNVIRQRNHGVSTARNVGLGMSKGDFVVFLDADDRLLPNALMTGVEALRSHRECAFVWGQCRHINADGVPIAARLKPVIEQDYYLNLLRTNYIRTPAVAMYRRKVFSYVGGFNPKLVGGEDYDLHLRIARRFLIHCHGKVVADYRIHSESAMHSSAPIARSTLAALRLQAPYVRRDKRLREAYRRGMRGWRALFAERLWNELVVNSSGPQRNWTCAWRSLWALARFDPNELALRGSAQLYRAIFKSNRYEALRSDPRSQ